MISQYNTELKFIDMNFFLSIIMVYKEIINLFIITLEYYVY